MRLRGLADGTTQPNLNTDLARRLMIPLPPLPEQRAIAGVLGALDDKIEVNRKTARVLEGIARAVFTSWFVDFDPVRRHPHPPTPRPPTPAQPPSDVPPGPPPSPPTSPPSSPNASWTRPSARCLRGGGWGRWGTC